MVKVNTTDKVRSKPGQQWEVSQEKQEQRNTDFRIQRLAHIWISFK